MMNVLIVGAGSIGQLYGHMLQRGGADVGVYVKPKYVDDARQGYRLYNRSKGLDTPEHFQPKAVHTDAEEVQEADYDAAVLCIPSTALRGPWLPELTDALGDAAVVSLTPGLEDRDYIAQFVEKDRLATGLITAVSYPAPLPGEKADEPGTAYWLPPLTPAMFDGPAERLRPLLKSLKSGGMSTRKVDNLARLSAFGSGVLMPLVASLESVDWSMDTFKRSSAHRELFDNACDEISTVIEDHLGANPPLPMRFIGKTTIKGALMMAPIAAPFDLETYLQVHFTKVGEQTRQALKTYIELRSERDWDSPALQKLLESIE